MEEDLDKIINSADETTDLINCKISEARFPYMGKCCTRFADSSGTVYKIICPACKIWTSIPDGASLAVNTIFECSRYGYGKRVKEQGGSL